jgi:hypothetical protein
VVFAYAPGRGGHHAERLLAGFDGVLQVDGYVWRLEIIGVWARDHRRFRAQIICDDPAASVRIA